MTGRCHCVRQKPQSSMPAALCELQLNTLLVSLQTWSATVEPSTLYLSFISFNGEFILTAKSGER